MRSIGSVVDGQDVLRTRSGWHASKAARNDLGPDMLTLFDWQLLYEVRRRQQHNMRDSTATS